MSVAVILFVEFVASAAFFIVIPSLYARLVDLEVYTRVNVCECMSSSKEWFFQTVSQPFNPSPLLPFPRTHHCDRAPQ